MKKTETVKSEDAKKDGRKKLLGSALKANLGRRKAQARARKSDTDQKPD